MASAEQPLNRSENPFEDRRENLQLGEYTAPEKDRQYMTRLGRPNVRDADYVVPTEYTVQQVADANGDDQIAHDGEGFGHLLGKATGTSLENAGEDEVIVQGVGLTHPIIGEASQPVSEIEVNYHEPVMPGDALNYEFEDSSGGVESFKVFRGEEVVMDGKVKHGVLAGSNEDIEEFNGRNADIFVDSVGFNAQDCNIIAKAEAEFSPQKGPYDTSRKHRFSDEKGPFDLSIYEYRVQNGAETPTASVSFTLVEPDKDILDDLLATYGEVIDDEEISGTMSEPEELEEEAERLRSLLEKQ